MDSSSRRLRSQVPGRGTVTSRYLHKLIQSIEKRLTDRLTLIENDLKQRLCVAETSLESAHEKISSLEPIWQNFVKKLLVSKKKNVSLTFWMDYTQKNSMFYFMVWRWAQTLKTLTKVMVLWDRF